jgi:hypothetical protein
MRCQRMIRRGRGLLQSDPSNVSSLVRIVHQGVRFRSVMPPVWPFGKKKPASSLDEDAPAPIVYQKTQDEGIDSGSTDQQKADYKAALSFFGSDETPVQKATDQSVLYDGVVASTNVAINPPDHEDGITWVHHTDGYHYKQAADGTFDPIAHTLGDDGAYVPYA